MKTSPGDEGGNNNVLTIIRTNGRDNKLPFIPFQIKCVPRSRRSRYVHACTHNMRGVFLRKHDDRGPGGPGPARNNGPGDYVTRDGLGPAT